jgi:hypothetical protein
MEQKVLCESSVRSVSPWWQLVTAESQRALDVLTAKTQSSQSTLRATNYWEIIVTISYLSGKAESQNNYPEKSMRYKR